MKEPWKRGKKGTNGNFIAYIVACSQSLLHLVTCVDNSGRIGGGGEGLGFRVFKMNR